MTNRRDSNPLAEEIAMWRQSGFDWRFIADHLMGDRCDRDYVRKVCLAEDLRREARVERLRIGVAVALIENGHWTWRYKLKLAKRAWHEGWTPARARRGGEPRLVA